MVATSSHHSLEIEGPGGDAAGTGGVMQLGARGNAAGGEDAAGMGCCLVLVCSKTFLKVTDHI